MREGDKGYYCQQESGQWNVAIEIVQKVDGLLVVKAPIGKEGLCTDTIADGFGYMIVTPDTIHETQQ